jgi:hypothetical protein
MFVFYEPKQFNFNSRIRNIKKLNSRWPLPGHLAEITNCSIKPCELLKFPEGKAAARNVIQAEGLLAMSL